MADTLQQRPVPGKGGQGKSVGRRERYLWVALGVSLLVNLVQGITGGRTQTQLTQTRAAVVERTKALEQTTTSLDSINDELQLRLAQMRRLGADTGTLAQAGRALAKDLAAAKAQHMTDKRRLRALREKVEGYGELLNEKDKQIAKLTTQRDKLFTETRSLKTSIVSQTDSLRVLTAHSTELEGKVAVASVLRAEGMRITFLDGRDNEREEDVVRAKRLAKLKVALRIADNKVAAMGAKEIVLVVQDPNANILQAGSPTAGRFTTADGAELPCTVRQSFIFDNQQPRVTFVYDRGGAYIPGPYRIEVWCEGHRIGTGGFVVR